MHAVSHGHFVTSSSGSETNMSFCDRLKRLRIMNDSIDAHLHMGNNQVITKKQRINCPINWLQEKK